MSILFYFLQFINRLILLLFEKYFFRYFKFVFLLLFRDLMGNFQVRYFYFYNKNF